MHYGARRGGHAPYKNSSCFYFHLRKVEAGGQSWRVENTEPHPETFAQVLAELLAEYGATGSAVARRIDVSTSTVNTWLHGKRTPRPDAIRALAAAYPKFTEARLAAAAERKMPGPLSPEAKERLLEVFEGLTEEQQAMLEIQARALRDSNR